MILIIDNYDSFVFNLARYVGLIGRQRRVIRNDAITMQDIWDMKPEAIILSPGPKTPKESGICKDIIAGCYKQIPILGICLGHQCIGEVFGGKTIRAPYPCHGKTSMITHRDRGMFMGLPNPLKAARYHALITDIPDNAPLDVIATTQDDDIVMGIKQSDYPVYGLQFHPESILTEYGLDIIRNFTTISDAWHDMNSQYRAA